ncbi:MAG: pyridoxamine 5'-phosphate oxidase family protein [Oscillospiraceae bacterium]|nr:pyridoxamine 5'-phosphate oxidase family protein [Oscillospiraceae bacterium]MBR0208854.1 pyridoxamine 5'-phosphate oxidase family protein [Oscillospiraceae bacterium]
MRRKDREIADESAIRSILARARVLHLGMLDGEYPYVVPMHYGFFLEEGKLTLYTHCAKEGHKLDLLRRDGRVFVEIDTDEALLPGETACAWGACYSSVMGRGRASIVEDGEEKCRALSLLMQTQTGEAYSFTPQMAAAVTVIRIDAEEFTAKARKKNG